MLRSGARRKVRNDIIICSYLYNSRKHLKIEIVISFGQNVFNKNVYKNNKNVFP